MADNKEKSSGLEQSADRGHPMPRRVAPETSVTLQNHRLAREASRKASLLDPSAPQTANSPQRDSSGESHDTGASDPKKWFDRSNHNPTAIFDAGSMDVDPPFFQKETDSSNEERRDGRTSARSSGFACNQDIRPRTSRRATQSSSVDEFRGVIDDLTIENKRLKEELKRYKQFGSDMMREEKLFEIKVHGLPGWRKRELEATLRDFAAGLQSDSGSRESRESPSQHRKSAKHGKHPYYPTSSSSWSRPVDSAYATMSTGPSSNAPNSVGPSLGRPSMASRTKSSQQKVENFLRDTPDGLFPRRVEMTDKEKKKLVVRRLEQLFTGKMRGRTVNRNQSVSSLDAPGSSDPPVMGPPRVPEANREAHIQQYFSQKKQHSRDNFSTSNSNGDQTESGGNGVGSRDGGSNGRGGSNTSPPTPALPEQRPTRPLDLDPDRVQIPSENMKYIKHLGLVPTEFLAGKKTATQDVSPDADGWVYLNLLCNLAQLHMVNVTPAFIRSAVTEKSTKFQLSPDGRKIRWRGGTVGTRFSSDSSVDNSQKSPSVDETDGSNEGGQRKRLKTSGSGPVSVLGGSSIGGSRFKPQLSHSPHSFHYKPLFVHRSSSLDSSVVGTTSQPSDGGLDDSNPDQWDYSGSGSSKRKRRQFDGAIIYYHGAPFCTDLSGDLGESSPTTYLTSTGHELESIRSPPFSLIHRSLSGSSLPVRPLSDPRLLVAEALDVDLDKPPTLVNDDDDSLNDEVAGFPWCDDPEHVQVHPIEPTLEPCGLGGVMPEDHFAVVVTTRRTFGHAGVKKPIMAASTADAIVSRLASIRTSSPLPPVHPRRVGFPIETEYLMARVRRMNPVPLPPAAMFLPPFSSDESSDESEEELDSFDEDMLGQDDSSFGVLMSQRANPHHSDGYREDERALSEEEAQDGSSDDDDRLEMRKRSSISRGSAGSRKTQHQEVMPVGSLQSSVATAGGVESGYNSSMEEH